MNIALLTAGGTGSRMHQETPKQFMIIENKPLIVHTIECFQKSDEIESVVIVCLEGWEKKVWEWVNKFSLNKVKYVVKGGATGQESIYNGFLIIKENYDVNSMIIIHDGNRPFLSESIIKKSIQTCKEKGNAVGYIPCQEVVFVSEDFISSHNQIDRSLLVRTQTPHVYYLRDLDDIFLQAKKRGLKECVATCSICAELGIETYFYLGSEKNIKITTPIDIEIFKALYKSDNDV